MQLLVQLATVPVIDNKSTTNSEVGPLFAQSSLPLKQDTQLLLAPTPRYSPTYLSTYATFKSPTSFVICVTFAVAGTSFAPA